jgi:hypothetical protein
VSPVKYELGFYMLEEDILHSQCRENLKSYTTGLVYINVPQEFLKADRTHERRD